MTEPTVPGRGPVEAENASPESGLRQALVAHLGAGEPARSDAGCPGAAGGRAGTANGSLRAHAPVVLHGRTESPQGRPPLVVLDRVPAGCADRARFRRRLSVGPLPASVRNVPAGDPRSLESALRRAAGRRRTRRRGRRLVDRPVRRLHGDTGRRPRRGRWSLLRRSLRAAGRLPCQVCRTAPRTQPRAAAVAQARHSRCQGSAWARCL